MLKASRKLEYLIYFFDIPKPRNSCSPYQMLSDGKKFETKLWQTIILVTRHFLEIEI